LSQPLPLSPPLPSLDGRPPVPRDRPAEGSERSAQRHAFSRMLDRFAQSDRGQDADRDPVTAPQDQRPRERCSTTDDSPSSQDEATDSGSQTADPTAVPAAPTHSAAAPAEPATPAPDPAQALSIPAPSPTIVAVPTIAPPAPAVSNAAASATADAAPATSVSVVAAMPVVAAAGATAANGQAPVAAAPPAVAAMPAAVPAEPVADSEAPQAAADTPDFADVVVETTRTRRTAMATGAGEATAKAAKAAQADKAAAEVAAPQPGRLPAARADVDTPVAANSNQGQPQFRIIKADTSTAVLDAAAAGAREDRANAQSGADQAVASLTSIDSPRRTAEIYHKVAEAARPGADAPTPADQVSIRLLHAVADGKRAIQMHLHPAELGSIDVKMQWQGDKLTAQFTVDRPETLQILQREVPALERSLGQAGVNVDSGSLSFSLRQQQGNGKGSGEGFDQAVGNAAFGDGGELSTGDEPLGQVIRDGILSIRV
jgi:flagellar hook-length control protein FliK